MQFNPCSTCSKNKQWIHCKTCCPTHRPWLQTNPCQATSPSWTGVRNLSCLNFWQFLFFFSTSAVLFNTKPWTCISKYNLCCVLCHKWQVRTYMGQIPNYKHCTLPPKENSLYTRLSVSLQIHTKTLNTCQSIQDMGLYKILKQTNIKHSILQIIIIIWISWFFLGFSCWHFFLMLC